MGGRVKVSKGQRMITRLHKTKRRHPKQSVLWMLCYMNGLRWLLSITTIFRCPGRPDLLTKQAVTLDLPQPQSRGNATSKGHRANDRGCFLDPCWLTPFIPMVPDTPQGCKEGEARHKERKYELSRATLVPPLFPELVALFRLSNNQGDFRSRKRQKITKSHWRAAFSSVLSSQSNLSSQGGNLLDDLSRKTLVGKFGCITQCKGLREVPGRSSTHAVYSGVCMGMEPSSIKKG